MRPSAETRARQTSSYALDGLHALPCGCVAAVYTAHPWDMEVVSIEARGPLCVYAQHQAGRTLGMASHDPGRLSR